MRATYGAHTVTRLTAHLVWATRGRNRWLDPSLDERLSARIGERCIALGCKALAVGNASDHVHVLVEFGAAISIASLAHHLKGASSRALTLQLGSALRWQAGYYAETAGDIETLVAYVRGQREHHSRTEQREAWESAIV